MVNREVTWRIKCAVGTQPTVVRSVGAALDTMCGRWPNQYLEWSIVPESSIPGPNPASGESPVHPEASVSGSTGMRVALSVASSHRYLMVRWLKQANIEVRLVLRTHVPGAEVTSMEVRA